MRRYMALPGRCNQQHIFSLSIAALSRCVADSGITRDRRNLSIHTTGDESLFSVGTVSRLCGHAVLVPITKSGHPQTESSDWWPTCTASVRTSSRSTGSWKASGFTCTRPGPGTRRERGPFFKASTQRFQRMERSNGFLNGAGPAKHIRPVRPGRRKMSSRAGTDCSSTKSPVGETKEGGEIKRLLPHSRAWLSRPTLSLPEPGASTG
jgi:hypothetical protein